MAAAKPGPSLATGCPHRAKEGEGAWQVTPQHLPGTGPSTSQRSVRLAGTVGQECTVNSQGKSPRGLPEHLSPVRESDMCGSGAREAAAHVVPPGRGRPRGCSRFDCCLQHEDTGYPCAIIAVPEVWGAEGA